MEQHFHRCNNKRGMTQGEAWHIETTLQGSATMFPSWEMSALISERKMISSIFSLLEDLSQWTQHMIDKLTWMLKSLYNKVGFRMRLVLVRIVITDVEDHSSRFAMERDPKMQFFLWRMMFNLR